MNEDRNLVPRKLTSLERSKLALKFIKMNTSPEKYVLDNRYLER
jgi:S-adenosylhomocysteine hydrolase